MAIDPTAASADPESDSAAEPPNPAASPRAPVDIAEVAQRLKALFPALFTGPIKPLKLRIQVDLQQRAPGVFTRQALSAFFRRHTAATGYLLAVTKAPHRYDLDGQPAGEIAEEHRRMATEELGRRRQNRESREQLLEEQRRNRSTLLRDFERTTLTRANFCALKGVADADLDALLDIARGEADERRRSAPTGGPIVGGPAEVRRPTAGDRRPAAPDRAGRAGRRENRGDGTG